MTDVAKLEALGQMTAEADALGGPTPEQAEQQAAMDAAETAAREWGVIAYTIGGALSMLAPELRQVYTEDACMGWGRAMVPVADKYGWNAPSDVPELGLIIATAGLAVPSYVAVRRRLDAIKAKREADDDAKAKVAAQTVEAGTDGGTQ
ncbi:MAG TPA: hypothetical protein VNO84_11610 [Burkholderiaceae bacterium]|nr:hypothetical protein [Burkholderiaceae bacterium]